MKRISLLFVLAAMVCAFFTGRAAPAQGRMYCISIKLNKGYNYYGDSLEVYNLGSGDVAGEVFPWQAAGSELVWPMSEGYMSYLTLYELFWDESFYGTLYPNTPSLVDVDGNQKPDFFEVSKAVNATSGGSWSAGIYGGSGSLQITWTRAGGSRTGKCTLKLDNERWFTFTNAFEILEYNGPVSYTPGSNTVSGTFNFTQTGVPGSTLDGSFLFNKVATNKYNELTLQPGLLTNAATAQSRSFTNHLFYRDTAWPSNYNGYVEFDDDGDLGTPHGYAVWILAITDPHDANANGIPDFSDDPVALPRTPQMSLSQTSTNLLLTVRGDVGRTHDILYASPAITSTWQTALSTTLTSDPQIIALPFPATTRFWRVQAQ